MRQHSYLIDTNILIGLEDNHTVQPAYAEFSNLAARHKIDVYVHEVAREDIEHDNDAARKAISLSKVAKFQSLSRRRGLSDKELELEFGPLKKPNDVVDATLLHALMIGAADFLVTQDQGLHSRAQKHSPDLARRVLFVADAAQLITQTYEPKQVPVRHVAEVEAYTIDHEDEFFDSLRDGYSDFNTWWQTKCIAEHRPCWVVYDDDKLAGLIVRKDETPDKTDARTNAQRILKLCTFKVRPEKRGIKLGELLLKQALWYCQHNGYDLAYLTAYEEQASLISLLEYYGFRRTAIKGNNETIFERSFSAEKLKPDGECTDFEQSRLNYPRFVYSEKTEGFGIPIKEHWHDVLFPDLREVDLLSYRLLLEFPTKPGNTIRKVYLCQSQSYLGEPGSILFFYKGLSNRPPSQAITAIGLLEELNVAKSTSELVKMTGGRSVYSEAQIRAWNASEKAPVKVINFLLIGYIDPPIHLPELRKIGVVKKHPQQSIYRMPRQFMNLLLERANLGFSI